MFDIYYNSKYTYKGSDVLINNLGIKDAESLEKAEKVLTAYRLAKLYMEPIKGNFDLNHLCAIHKYIFGELYSFAGEIRDECIQKGSTLFCRPMYIYQSTNYVLEDMKKRSHNIRSKQDLVKFLAYYYSELNAIHPFRDGNGRTIREFLREYVEYLNRKFDFDSFELDYSVIDDNDKMLLLKGSEISAAKGDTELLEKFFEKVVVSENEKKKENNPKHL